MGIDDLIEKCDDCLERDRKKEIVYNGMYLQLCETCYEIRREQIETSPKL